MITAVDTNLLFDVLFPDSAHATDAESALVDALTEGALIISEPVYAELASHFPHRGDLDRFLLRTGIRLIASDPRTLYEAGRAWRRYSERRRASLTCPNCGAANHVRCERCDAPLRARQHIVADFMIGAHAAVHADRLLTRDKGYYAKYFPDLKVG